MEEDKQEEGESAPVENGGSTELYTWTQSLSEVQLCFRLPEDVTAKLLNIEIEPEKGKIALKNGKIIKDDQWNERVESDAAN